MRFFLGLEVPQPPDVPQTQDVGPVSGRGPKNVVPSPVAVSWPKRVESWKLACVVRHVFWWGMFSTLLVGLIGSPLFFTSPPFIIHLYVSTCGHIENLLSGATLVFGLCLLSVLAWSGRSFLSLACLGQLCRC